MAQIMKRGDTRPTYLVQLIDNIGKPTQSIVPDLDTAASIRLLLRSEGAPDSSDPILIGDAAYWVDPTSPASYTGTVEYAWAVGDLAIPPGNYNIEIEVTWGPGEIETFPNDSYFKLTIVADLETG